MYCIYLPMYWAKFFLVYKTVHRVSQIVLYIYVCLLQIIIQQLTKSIWSIKTCSICNYLKKYIKNQLTESIYHFINKQKCHLNLLVFFFGLFSENVGIHLAFLKQKIKNCVYILASVVHLQQLLTPLKKKKSHFFLFYYFFLKNVCI